MSTTPLTTVETSTGSTVDLTGLSDREKVWCLLTACADPETYNGGKDTACICGQAASALGYDGHFGYGTGPFGSDTWLLYRLNIRDPHVSNALHSIWNAANREDLRSNHAAAMEMAHAALFNDEEDDEEE